MTGHRAIAAIATLLVAPAWAAAPAAAAVNPLLSGYGGPGEGNQAILGSTLVGGSSTGAGPGEGGGAGGPGGPAGGAGALSGSGGAGGGARRVPGARGHRGRGPRSAGRASDGGSAATRGGGPVVSLADASSSQTLGLSSEDVVYILVALGALAVTGVLTGRLARRSR
jgi:hypothetical protein